jgi:hypothetical protein
MPVILVSKASAPAAAALTLAVTLSTSLGQVAPRNFNVTCQLSERVHLAGIRSRYGSMAEATFPLIRSGTSTAMKSLSGLASGLDARSRAIS